MGNILNYVFLFGFIEVNCIDPSNNSNTALYFIHFPETWIKYD